MTDILTIHVSSIDVLAAVLRTVTNIIPDVEVRLEGGTLTMYTPEETCEATASAAARKSTPSKPSTTTRSAPVAPSPFLAATSAPPAATEPAPSSPLPDDAPTCGEYHPLEEDIACDRVVGHSGPHSYLEANGHPVRWRPAS